MNGGKRSRNMYVDLGGKPAGEGKKAKANNQQRCEMFRGSNASPPAGDGGIRWGTQEQFGY